MIFRTLIAIFALCFFARAQNIKTVMADTNGVIHGNAALEARVASGGGVVLTNEVTALSNRVVVIEGGTNNWNAAAAWGDHAAAGYLPGATWVNWLATNTYVKVEADTIAIGMVSNRLEKASGVGSTIGWAAEGYLYLTGGGFSAGYILMEDNDVTCSSGPLTLGGIDGVVINGLLPPESGTQPVRLDDLIAVTNAIRTNGLDLKADKSTTLTINGIPGNLSSNNVWTVSVPDIPSGIVTNSTAFIANDSGSTVFGTYGKAYSGFGEMTLMHKDLADPLNFAFTQNLSGNTVFNGYDIYFRSRNQTRMFVSTGGKIGIGPSYQTSSPPTFPLEISVETLISNNLTVCGDTVFYAGVIKFGPEIGGRRSFFDTDGTNIWWVNVNYVTNALTSN